MKTFYLIKKAIIIGILSLIVACGAETVAAIVFIPAFAGDWAVSGEENYFFNLQSEDEGKESGSITGFEFDHPTEERKNNELEGTFNGLNINITIKRENGDVHYTGKMTPESNEDHTITKIVLNNISGNEQLVLIEPE